VRKLVGSSLLEGGWEADRQVGAGTAAAAQANCCCCARKLLLMLVPCSIRHTKESQCYWQQLQCRSPVTLIAAPALACGKGRVITLSVCTRSSSTKAAALARLYP
jgi:hypothetical protein